MLLVLVLLVLLVLPVQQHAVQDDRLLQMLTRRGLISRL